MLLSCKLENVDIVLAKPLTYMNSSGVAVQIVMSRIGATTRSLILVSDDADLPLGRIRLRSKGGSGGHHGVRSIIEATGTGDFLRLRMGIGRPSKAADLAVYVLDKVTDCERITLEKSVQRAAEAVLATIRAGIQAAMNIYNAPLVEQAC
jgi:PTH1 family peptidyl-tRNA hydrolase